MKIILARNKYYSIITLGIFLLCIPFKSRGENIKTQNRLTASIITKYDTARYLNIKQAFILDQKIMRPVEKEYGDTLKEREIKPINIPVRANDKPCLNAASNFNKILSVYEFSEEQEENIKKAFQDEAYIDAAIEYRSACFKPISDLKDSPYNNAEIVDHLGILAFDKQPFCTAFRTINNLALTAKHCFFNKSTGQKLPTALQTSKVAFLPLADLTKSYPINLLIEQAEEGEISHKDDHIEISVNGISPFKTQLQKKYPKILDKLLLIGVYGYLPSKSLTENIVWTQGGYCNVTFITESGCVMHGCQSAPGFSGSPLLTISGSKVDVIGMHLSSAANDGNCRAVDRAVAGQGNLGFILPKI